MSELSYKSALELKEAGFPQDKCSMIWKGVRPGLSTDTPLGIPTLSELIEACGDEVFVTNMKGYRDSREVTELWMAEKYYGIEKPQEIAQGKTPEEAVKNLWIKLHGR